MMANHWDASRDSLQNQDQHDHEEDSEGRESNHTSPLGFEIVNPEVVSPENGQNEYSLFPNRTPVNGQHISPSGITNSQLVTPNSCNSLQETHDSQLGPLNSSIGLHDSQLPGPSNSAEESSQQLHPTGVRPKIRPPPNHTFTTNFSPRESLEELSFPTTFHSSRRHGEFPVRNANNYDNGYNVLSPRRDSIPEALTLSCGVLSPFTSPTDDHNWRNSGGNRDAAAALSPIPSGFILLGNGPSSLTSPPLADDRSSISVIAPRTNYSSQTSVFSPNNGNHWHMPDTELSTQFSGLTTHDGRNDDEPNGATNINAIETYSVTAETAEIRYASEDNSSTNNVFSDAFTSPIFHHPPPNVYREPTREMDQREMFSGGNSRNLPVHVAPKNGRTLLTDFRGPTRRLSFPDNDLPAQRSHGVMNPMNGGTCFNRNGFGTNSLSIGNNTSFSPPETNCFLESSHCKMCNDRIASLPCDLCLMKFCTSCLDLHVHHCRRQQLVPANRHHLPRGGIFNRGMRPFRYSNNRMSMLPHVRHGLAVNSSLTRPLPPFRPPIARCSVHDRYLARYYDPATRRQHCVVCILKRIGSDPPIRNPSLIPFPAPTQEEFPWSVSLLQTLMEEVPRTINRFRSVSMYPFLEDEVNGHLVFLEQIPIDRDPSLLQFQDQLNCLLVYLNKVILRISNVYQADETRQICNTVNQCHELNRTLSEQAGGPISTPIVPDSCAPGVGSNSRVSGPACSGVVQVGEETVFFLEVRDNSDRSREWNRDAIKIDIRSTSNSQVRHRVESANLVGVVSVKFTIDDRGDYLATVMVNGENVRDTPFQIHATNEEIVYKTFFEPTRHVGESVAPSQVGLFSRPWGVHFASDGGYIVADRSNHRIIILDSNCLFRFAFGVQGHVNGELFRPSKAVELNYESGLTHLVVADKDNHRLQIFTQEGLFVARTPASHELKYPWDVCVTSERVIVCTDARSNRLPCFNNKLEPIRILLLPPECVSRGICGGYLNHVIVTEFTKCDMYIVFAPSSIYTPETSSDIAAHHSLRLYAPRSNPQFLGPKEKSEKNAERLQGICRDARGRLLVADSRQNKIRVLTYLGKEIAGFDVLGEPQGVVVGRNSVAVINNTRNTLDLYTNFNLI